MRTKHLAVTIIPLVLLCLVLSHLLLRAQNPLPPNPDFADALWVARSHGLSKVSTSSASVLFEIIDTQDARAIAVDAQRGLLWVYRQNTLSAYDFEGKLSISIPLGQHGDKGSSEEVALSVNPENGTIWLGVKKTLYHFSGRGKWLSIHSLSSEVRALSWDATTACQWVATRESVIALNDKGAMCHKLDLGQHPEVQDLTVDPIFGDIWVALKKTVRRYDATRNPAFELRLDKVAYLAGDHQGGIWLATDKELMRMDRFGRVLFPSMPFKGPDKIVALIADPADASVWVASKNRVSHISADGRHLDHLELKGEIRDLAFYTDIFSPTLSITEPHDGTALRTNTPTIELDYRDAGLGVDVSTLHLQVNGLELAVACQHDDTGSTCTPNGRLPEGLVTLTAQIQDYAGNRTEADAVHFTVDTTAPGITVATPAHGTSTNQPSQALTGYLSEAAVLTLNGTGVTVAANLSFTHSPLVLHEGLNTFDVVATDPIGNSSQRRIQVTLDTVPPTAITKSQLALQNEPDGQVRVTGQSGSVEPGARVSITNTRTGQTIIVTANADGSFTGVMLAQNGDLLSVVVMDLASNVSAPITVGVGSALPPDPTTIAPPLNRTVATDLSSATAFLYTGSQPIQMG